MSNIMMIQIFNINISAIKNFNRLFQMPLMKEIMIIIINLMEWVD